MCASVIKKWLFFLAPSISPILQAACGPISPYSAATCAGRGTRLKMAKSFKGTSKGWSGVELIITKGGNRVNFRKEKTSPRSEVEKRILFFKNSLCLMEKNLFPDPAKL
jgi:hypothetical protein